jgi:hypothetical protein
VHGRVDAIRLVITALVHGALPLVRLGFRVHRSARLSGGRRYECSRNPLASHQPQFISHTPTHLAGLVETLTGLSSVSGRRGTRATLRYAFPIPRRSALATACTPRSADPQVARSDIDMRAGAKLLVLPQRPYLPIGTLRRAVTYPEAAESRSVEQSISVFDTADRFENWQRPARGSARCVLGGVGRRPPFVVMVLCQVQRA